MVKSTLYRLNLSMTGGPLVLYRGVPYMVRSKLYRLNLSMSGEALILYRGVRVQ